MSQEFEAVVLNKLFNDSEYFNKAVPILDSKHFENIGNQEVYKLIKKYYTMYGENAGYTEIISMVHQVENLEIRSAIKASLISVRLVEESKNIDFLLDQTIAFVKDSMYLEALRIGSDGLMKCDEELKKKAEQIMDERAKVTIDSDLGLDFDDIQSMISYYQERNIGILTQHDGMNKRLGTGFLPGTLSLIMAASGIGKSLLMTDFISGFIKQGKSTLLITLEMGDKEVMKRVHANTLDLPINSLIDISKTKEELAMIKCDDPTHEFVSREMIEDAYAKLKAEGTAGKLFIKDFPSGTFSALQLIALVESYKMEKGIEFDAIFVDYVGIAKSDLLTPNVGLYSYIKSIVEEFRSAAKKLELPIISASQLNRGAVNNTEASNDAVSDSMGSVMTADWIMFLLQDEDMKAKNEIVCKCTKNRFNGRTDCWMMNIDYTRMRFADMLMESEQESYNPAQPVSDANDDFGIITPRKMENAETFADDEIKDIQRVANEQRDDKVPDYTKSADSDIDDLMSQFGL